MKLTMQKFYIDRSIYDQNKKVAITDYDITASRGGSKIDYFALKKMYRNVLGFINTRKNGDVPH